MDFYVTGITPAMKEEISPSPQPLLQSNTPSSFPWLADKLTKATQMSPTDISKIVQILVREGIDNEVVLSGIVGKDYIADYLSSIDIKALGVQQHLLRLHEELRKHVKASPSHSAVEEVATAKELRDMKLKLDALSEQVGSLSSETDSEVVVGGNQKMISKSKQSTQQAGHSSSESILSRLASAELAIQEIACHVSLQAENEPVSSPEVIAKHQKDKQNLFKI